MDWQDQLISVYLTVCKAYEQKLCENIVRLSNYVPMTFTDEEVITIYLNGIISGHHKLKNIYEYTYRHLRDWFPNLPSYEGFNYRINKISHLFEELVGSLLVGLPTNIQQDLPALIDSMPIIMAQRGRRFKPCVAREIATSNGYCATKNLHYYGVKLHLMGQYTKGSMPIPINLLITNAGTGDIKVLDEMKAILPHGLRVFADKAYQRGGKPIEHDEGITLFTPVKKEKGQKLLDAADRLLSSAISSVRQPIECIFSWIEEKTKIQVASKVRSYEGLMVHIFGKLAAAFILLRQKVCP